MMYKENTSVDVRIILNVSSINTIGGCELHLCVNRILNGGEIL